LGGGRIFIWVFFWGPPPTPPGGFLWTPNQPFPHPCQGFGVFCLEGPVAGGGVFPPSPVSRFGFLYCFSNFQPGVTYSHFPPTFFCFFVTQGGGRLIFFLQVATTFLNFLFKNFFFFTVSLWPQPPKKTPNPPTKKTPRFCFLGWLCVFIFFSFSSATPQKNPQSFFFCQLGWCGGFGGGGEIFFFFFFLSLPTKTPGLKVFSGFFPPPPPLPPPLGVPIFTNISPGTFLGEFSFLFCSTPPSGGFSTKKGGCFFFLLCWGPSVSGGFFSPNFFFLFCATTPGSPPHLGFGWEFFFFVSPPPQQGGGFFKLPVWGGKGGSLSFF